MTPRSPVICSGVHDVSFMESLPGRIPVLGSLSIYKKLMLYYWMHEKCFLISFHIFNRMQVLRRKTKATLKSLPIYISLWTSWVSLYALVLDYIAAIDVTHSTVVYIIMHVFVSKRSLSAWEAIRIRGFWASEVGQQVKVLTAKSYSLSPTPKTQMVEEKKKLTSKSYPLTSMCTLWQHTHTTIKFKVKTKQNKKRH